MINNENGSILVVTLAFVLVFTLLGFGSLHHVFVQNEIAEKEKASAKAFWLADGIAERTFARLKENWVSENVTNITDSLWGGTYNLYFYPASDCNTPFSCEFKSQGLVDGQYRTIRATVDDPGGGLVFTSWEEI